MALVVDASALVLATTSSHDGATRLRRRLVGETSHAPHLIDAEFGDVLRRLHRQGAVTVSHAETLLAHAPRLVDHRHGHHGALGSAAFALRDNLSFYDALYVALAAALALPLLTADQRLAAAPGLPCRVEAVGG